MRWSVLTFVIGLAGSVALLLLLGRIRILGVLRDKRTGGFSPSRLQSLAVTLGGAATYLGMVLSEGKLMDPPVELVVALGGSHSLYLGAKAFSAWRRHIS